MAFLTREMMERSSIWPPPKYCPPPEIDETGLDTFTIRKGNYICEKINNWKEDESQVKNIFEKLLAQPGIDPNGYCVEEYLDDKDMIAMVTLK